MVFPGKGELVCHSLEIGAKAGACLGGSRCPEIPASPHLGGTCNMWAGHSGVLEWSASLSQ